MTCYISSGALWDLVTLLCCCDSRPLCPCFYSGISIRHRMCYIYITPVTNCYKWAWIATLSDTRVDIWNIRVPWNYRVIRAGGASTPHESKTKEIPSGIKKRKIPMVLTTPCYNSWLCICDHKSSFSTTETNNSFVRFQLHTRNILNWHKKLVV